MTHFNFRETPLGSVFESDLCIAVFGFKAGTFEEFQESFPDVGFQLLRQVHSDIVVQADVRKTVPVTGDGTQSLRSAPNLPEADAHWTAQSSIALCIRTADCLPILIEDRTNHLVAAVHAGWRGVQSRIVLKTLNVLRANSQKPGSFRALIGPHISATSFEVGEDVAGVLHQFGSSLGIQARDFLGPHPRADKAFVNLERLVRGELIAAGLSAAEVTSLPHDTMTDGRYHSFRRDGENSGRQISFVFMK